MSSLRRTSWQEEEVESIGLSLEALQLLCWGCCLLPGFFCVSFLVPAGLLVLRGAAAGPVGSEVPAALLPWALSPAWQTPNFSPLRPDTALTQSYLYRREAGRHKKITLWVNGKVQGAPEGSQVALGALSLPWQNKTSTKLGSGGGGWQSTGFAKTFPAY